MRTLGTLDLRGSDGGELRAVLAQPKRAALLAYLALARPRGFHQRDALVVLFWPEHDAERARNSLSQSLHVLRQSLGAGAIASRNGDRLGLEWADFWCDAVAFEEALDAGRLAEAVELYRGELLDGFYIVGAPEFERWLAAERERLGRRCLAALEKLAAERESAGDSTAAVIWWRRLAARDPYNSRVALRLMRALAAAGDPAGAVQHAQLHEKLLREALGVPPDAEIAAMVGQLRSGSWGESRRAPRRESPAAATARERGTAGTEEMEGARPDTGEAASPPVAASEDDRSAPAPGRADVGRRRRLGMAAVALAALCAAAVGAAFFRRAAADAPALRSLAVLPPDDLSADSTQPGFADGIHDALITELARYPDLTVISRTSVERYKGTKKTTPEIARELKVDGIVEGTVVRESGRVRMDVRLVHGPSDRHLWARSYVRDLGSVLVLQSDLANAIAREVRVATVAPERNRWRSAAPGDSVPDELHLRQLHLRGRHAEVSRSPLGMQTATEYYRRAIERDSSFAPGYAALSVAYALKAHYDLAPKRAMLDSARMLAQRAVELDSTLSEARTALALSLGNFGQWRAAEREFRRAIELAPSDPGARYWYGMLLVGLGRGAEALAQAERTLELDPLAPRAALSTRRYAHYLITGERPHLQLPVHERRPILKLEPGEPWARARDAVELAESGRCAEARADMLRARRQVPDDNMVMLAFAGTLYLSCGERARLRALLAEAKRRPDAGDHGLRVAMLHARLGEKDSAFVWLERHRWLVSELAILSGDQLLDPLRSDPRLDRLMRRLGVR